MRVPVYERQSTQLRGGDNVPRASDEAFGAGIGRATASLGAAIATTGQAFGDALEKNQNEQDAITAKIVAAETEANIQNKANELMLNGDPANAAMVPDQVREYAVQTAAENAKRVAGKYQNHYKLSTAQSMLHTDIRTRAWATKTSADYAGQRVTQITGQQAGYLMEAPDQVPRATQAVRGVIEEMNAPEWRKNQLREQAAIELMAPVKEGYLKRAADLEAKGDFKGSAATAKEGMDVIRRLNTEMPMLMGVKPLAPAMGPRVQLAPHDRDATIKTVWAEARGESPDGQSAVAEVIRNRAIKSGQTAYEVVKARGQFEPWSNPKTVAQMEALGPGDPRYDAIGKIVDGVFAGEVPDKVGGAEFFYSPKENARLAAERGDRRAVPAWATPNTRVASLGTHDFHVGAGGPITPKDDRNYTHVVELQPQVAGIRKQPIMPELKSQLQVAASNVGVVAEVVSGGQDESGPNRTGSHRHDNGGAADIQLRDPKTGRLLDMSIPEDKARMADFVRIAVANGAKGVGAGEGYMGKNRIHVGGGSETSWGGADWIEQARLAGKGGVKVASIGNVTPDTPAPKAQGQQVAQAQPTPGTATMAGTAGSQNYTKFMKGAEHEFSQFINKTSVGQQKAQHDLDIELESEEESIRQKGSAGQFVSDEKLQGVYDPPRLEQIRQEREANMDYNTATGGWAAKSAAERSADLEKLNPDNRPVGPDYAYRLKNYQAAATLNANMTKAQSTEQKFAISRQITLAKSGRGSMPSFESIDQNPALSAEDRDVVLKQFVAAEGDNVAYQATAAKFNNKGAGLFNRLDPTERGHTDRIFNDLVATHGPEAALQIFVDRTGYVPDTAVKAINGGLSSGDAAATRSALQTATNIMVTGNRPFAFEGAKNNDSIEKAAINFDYYVNERGMTADAATKRWLEEQTPAYKQGVGKIKKEDIAPRIKKEVSINDMGKGFDLGLFGTDSAIDKLISRDPVVGFNTGQREKAYAAFVDILTEKYADTPNADIELAKKHAIHEMKTKGGWGVTEINGSKILMRYPPEENPGFRGFPNASEAIAGQAQREIKAAGFDVDRSKIQLVPTAATPQRVKDGKPGQYYVQWWDEAKGGVQTLQPGKAFEPSVKEAQAEATAKSDKAYLEHRNTPYAPRSMPVEPASPAVSRAQGSAAPVVAPPAPTPLPRQGIQVLKDDEGNVMPPTGGGFTVPSAGSRAGGSKKKPTGGFNAE